MTDAEVADLTRRVARLERMMWVLMGLMMGSGMLQIGGALG